MPSRLSKLLPRSRWSRRVIVVLVMLGITWLVAPKLAEPYVRGKLQEMIASKLNAELRMDDLTYLPPFGVRVRGAKLVTKSDGPGSGEFDLLKIARIDLRLAKLPFGDGPLVIERFDVQQPEVYLVLTDQGLLGSAALTPPPPPQQQSPAPTPAQPAPAQPGVQPEAKLSSMFQLRHFALWGGRVVLEDRTRPGSVPMVWSELNASSESRQTSPSAYSFDLKADHKGVAALTAAGSFDLDALHLLLTKAELEVKTDPSLPTSGMPAQVQSILRKYEVAGKLGMQATADVPLKKLDAATFDVTLRVTDGSAKFPQTDTPLDRLNVVVRSETLPTTVASAPRPIRVRVEQFEAAGRDMLVAMSGQPTLHLDRAANTWTLTDVAADLNLGTANTPDQFDLAGRVSLIAGARGSFEPVLNAADYHATLTPVGVRVRPPKFPLPLEDVGGAGEGGGAIELRPGIIAVKDLAARYGGDEIVVRGVRFPIPADPRDLKHTFAVEEIDGRIDFRAQPNPPYPINFNKIVQRLRPGGVFEVGGGSFVRVTQVPGERRRKADYFFSVSTDDASLGFTDKNIRLTHVNGDTTVSNLLVDIPEVRCALFGGAVVVGGKIVPKPPYALDAGRLVLSDLDLAQLGRAMRPEKPNEKLAGRASLDMTLAGEFDGELRGRGEFEVSDGDFWTLPVLGHIASQTKKDGGKESGGGVGTLGEAAGIFRIEGHRIIFDNAAVTSPALGLIGSGAIGLGGNHPLDLRIVAAPLGDWRENIRRTGIPIVSNVVGEVAGGIQRVLSVATSTLLYHFRVSGSVEDPNIQAVPAPVITDPIARLLGRMVQEKPEQKLIESVRTEPGK